MVTVNELRVIISGENQKLLATVKAADDRVNRFGESADAASNRASRGFDGITRTSDRMASSISRAMGVMTRLDLTQITLEESGERVREAQDRYNLAIADSGPKSREAIEANRELSSAQATAEKTALRARASYILVSAELVAMGGQAVRATAGLGLFRAGLGATTIAARTLRLALIGTGIGALVLGLSVLLGHLNRANDGTERYAQTAAAAEAMERRVAAATDEGSQALRRQIVAEEERIASLERGVAANKAARAEFARAQKLDPQILGIRALMQESEDLAGRLDAARQSAEALRKAVVPTEFKELTAALQAAGAGLNTFTLKQQEAILTAGGLTDVESAYLRVAAAEDETLRAAIEVTPALLDQMTVARRKGETMRELAARLDLTADQEDRLRASGQLVEEGLISQAEAADRAAEAQRKAAQEAERLADEQARLVEQARALQQQALDEHFNNLQGGLRGAGLELAAFTRGMQASILAAGGLDAVEQAFLGVQDAEAGLLREALKLNPALLDQISVTRLKGESNEQLAARLGLTTEQERRLRAQGRLTTEGILSQEEATRRLLDAQETSTRSFAAGQVGFVEPIPGAITFVRGETGSVSIIIQRLEVPVTQAGQTFDPATVGQAITSELQRAVREAFD